MGANERSMYEDGRKGGVFVGILYRGNAWKKIEVGTQPRSSIPSSFEAMTTAKSGREKDGFNTRTLRFGKRVNDLPGPGYYHKSTSFVKTTGSMSCKGYSSGFLSKDRRFSSGYASSMQGVPGPGEYKSRTYLHIKDDKYFNRSTTTAVFSKSAENLVPHKKKANALKSKHTPGPGTYSISDAFGEGISNSSPALPRMSSISAFKSGTTRFGTKSMDGASPGQYTLPDSFKVDEKRYTSFKSSSGRQGEVFRKGKRKKARGGVVQTGVTSAILSRGKGEVIVRPGPGTYEVGAEDIDAHGVSSMGKYSSSFGKTTTDRFGKPVDPKVNRAVSPGPGAYSLGSAGKPGGTSSVFLSTTDRNASSGLYTSAKAPGPCWYKPNTIDRKSFHLNTKKRWM